MQRTEPDNLIQKLAPFLLIGAVLIGAGLLIRSTRLGPGVGGDATIYITSARNLLAGKGLGLITAAGKFRLLPYFPPFFSLILAGAGILGLNLVGFANGLNIFMFMAFIGLVGYETLRVSRSVIMAVLAELLLAVSPILIPVYSWAMSEPLAIFLGFAGVSLLLVYLRRPERSIFFVVSALVCGLGILTRYANAAFLGTALVAILIFTYAPLRAKIIDAILYTLISLLPIAIWTVYDLSMTATVSSRSMVSGGAERITNLISNLAKVVSLWLLPESWTDVQRFPTSLVNGVVLVVMVFLAAWLILVCNGWFAKIKGTDPAMKHQVIQEDLQQGIWGWLFVLVIFIAGYLAVITAVSITTYPPITIASRMLSPVHAGVLWLVVFLAVATFQMWPRLAWLEKALPVVLALVILIYGWRSVRIVQMYSKLGLGYNSLEWQNSQTIQALQKLPPGQMIVTNEETAVLFLTGRTSYPLMEIYSDHPVEQFSRFGDGDLAKDPAQKYFRDGKAQLILFDTIQGQFDSIYSNRSAERVKRLVDGLIQDSHGSDGNIYHYPNR